VAGRKDAFRALGERLLESVTEYQRALYHEFLAAREEILWRYRYIEAARQDFEEASARASELRERLKELHGETEAQSWTDAMTAAEDLARAEGLARAAQAILSRPEFARRDYTEYEERISELAREAVEASEKLNEAVEEAFDRGERKIREAVEPPPTGPES
jgi:chromosome segregation ATPase